MTSSHIIRLLRLNSDELSLSLSPILSCVSIQRERDTQRL